MFGQDARAAVVSEPVDPTTPCRWSRLTGRQSVQSSLPGRKRRLQRNTRCGGGGRVGGGNEGQSFCWPRARCFRRAHGIGDLIGPIMVSRRSHRSTIPPVDPCSAATGEMPLGRALDKQAQAGADSVNRRNGISAASGGSTRAARRRSWRRSRTRRGGVDRRGVSGQLLDAVDVDARDFDCCAIPDSKHRRLRVVVPVPRRLRLDGM